MGEMPPYIFLVHARTCEGWRKGSPPRAMTDIVIHARPSAPVAVRGSPARRALRAWAAQSEVARRHTVRGAAEREWKARSAEGGEKGNPGPPEGQRGDGTDSSSWMGMDRCANLGFQGLIRRRKRTVAGMRGSGGGPGFELCALGR